MDTQRFLQVEYGALVAWVVVALGQLLTSGPVTDEFLTIAVYAYAFALPFLAMGFVAMTENAPHLARTLRRQNRRRGFWALFLISLVGPGLWLIGTFCVLSYLHWGAGMAFVAAIFVAQPLWNRYRFVAEEPL